MQNSECLGPKKSFKVLYQRFNCNWIDWWVVETCPYIEKNQVAVITGSIVLTFPS